MTEFVTRSWDVFESDDRTDPKAQIREGWSERHHGTCLVVTH